MRQTTPFPKDSVQLAIETTGRNGSLAVLSAESILWQTNLDTTARTAATLAPEIDRLLRWCSDQGHPPVFLSVADGPGSFTGLRIGVTTAKLLSYGMNLPVVGVDSLASIAAGAFHDRPDVQSIIVAVNAYRGQVFHGTFRRSELLAEVAAETDWTSHPRSVGIAEKEEWAEIVERLPADVHRCGESKCFEPDTGPFLDRTCDAVGVGMLGIRAAMLGQWSDPFALTPRYLKPSAAEEKAAAR